MRELFNALTDANLVNTVQVKEGFAILIRLLNEVYEILFLLLKALKDL